MEIKVKKEFGDFKLNIDFVSNAKKIAILGPSGCGKSMTLKAITGIITPDTGYIEVNNHVLFDSEKKINIKTQNRNVGYLFQNYALFPTMSVQKNIEAGIRGASDEKRSISLKLIEKLGLSGLENRLPAELSGGQQQRVALARILAYSPSIILLDEPFSALDGHLKDRLQRELFSELESYDGIVIMVTHDRDEAYRFSEDVVILDRGQTIIQGNTKKVFSNPKSMVAARLTGCKNISKASRISDYELACLDWGVNIKTKNILPNEFNYVGYRAHEFVPIWGDFENNCIPFNLNSVANLQFEKNFYICPNLKEYDESQILTWFAQRDKWELLEKKGYPNFLQFKEEHLLFLQ